MLEFLAAVLLLISTPGPGVLSVAGVGSGFGFKQGIPYLWGLFIGNFLVSFLVVSGIAAFVFSIPYMREVLLVASVAYLVYLAAKIAFSGSKIAFIHSEKAPALANGVSLQLINPKAYVVNTTLFAGFAFYPDNLFAETLIKYAILIIVWIAIHFAWLSIGAWLRKLALSEPVQRAINIGMAVAMLLAVGLAIV